MRIVYKSMITEDLLNKMTTELLLLKFLDHPNILNIFEIYEDEKCYYQVLELMEGGELLDEILARGE